MNSSSPAISANSTTAIIVAAGGSSRMGFDKLLAPLQGESVVMHALRAFQACGEISEIILIAPPERVAKLNLSPDVKTLPGGENRHDSVWQGIQAATGEFVAVHDGARPLILPEIIAEVIAAAKIHGAAALAKPVTETLKRADFHNQVTSATEKIDRSQLWSMETPQVFRRDWLLGAYQLVFEQNEIVTDEVSALQLSGHPVQLVTSPHPNLKITYPADLVLAERLIS